MGIAIITKKTSKESEAICEELRKIGSDVKIFSIFDLDPLNLEKPLISLIGYDVVYIRKYAPIQSIVLPMTLELKKMGKKVIENPLLRTFVVNKIYQMVTLRKHGIQVPKSYSITNLDMFKKLVRKLTFPLVCKNPMGTWGEEVWILRNEKEAISFLEKNINKYKGLILQDFIDHGNYDYRVYVINGKVSCAVKRIGKSDDVWKTNIHLGAKAVFIGKDDLKDDIGKISADSAKILKVNIAGVDVIEDRNKKPHILEVNSGPQFMFPGVEEIMKINAGRDIAKFLDNLDRNELGLEDWGQGIASC